MNSILKISSIVVTIVLCTVFGLSSGIIGVWSILCIIAPFISLILIGLGTFSIDKDGGVLVLVTLIVTILGLMYGNNRAYYLVDYYYVNFAKAFFLASIIILTVAYFVDDLKQSVPLMLMFVLLQSVHIFQVFILMNCNDGLAIRMQGFEVVGKIYEFDGSQVQYLLQVDVYGSTEEASVTLEKYKNTSVGESIRLDVYMGNMGMEYIERLK